MHYQSNDFKGVLRQIKRQLIRMGWVEHPRKNIEMDKTMKGFRRGSPQIVDEVFWYENCLKKINPHSEGEAYYALEIRGLALVHLAWSCNQNNPNNHRPMDTLDAFDILHERMLEGIPFDYGTGIDGDSGTIRVVDWEHPENNTFEFIQNWRGALEDDFAWDFVLCVNAIPVCGILLEKSDGAPCRAAHELAQYQLDKDFRFPIYCHAIVIGDGEKMYIGDPWEELEHFGEIDSLEKELQPANFLVKYIKGKVC